MTTLNTSRSAQIHHEVRNQDIEYIMKCALLDVFNVDIQDTNLASNNKKIKKKIGKESELIKIIQLMTESSLTH